jgi:Tol biopolymer transport system component
VAPPVAQADSELDINVMNADGSGVARLTAGSGPAWSPDDSRIAFTTTNGVSVINVDGSGERVPAAGSDPTWSPDGGRVAFVRQG